MQESLNFMVEAEESEDPNAYMEAWYGGEGWLTDSILWLYDSERFDEIMRFLLTKARSLILN